MENNNLLLSADDLINWYMMHVNHNITIEFINHLLDFGIIKYAKNSLIELESLNDLLLCKANGEYIKNANNEYIIKTNRLCSLKHNNTLSSDNSVSTVDGAKQAKASGKFIIEKIGNNKLKLKKIK